MKRIGETRKDICVRIVQLADLEYKAFKDDFKSKDYLLNHLIRSFSSKRFATKSVVGAFGGHDTYMHDVERILNVYVDRVWKDDTAMTSVGERRTGPKRKRDEPSDSPPAKTLKAGDTLVEMSKRPVGLSLVGNDLKKGFELVNWVDYSSVSSINPKADGKTTIFLNNFQENALVEWSINRNN